MRNKSISLLVLVGIAVALAAFFPGLLSILLHGVANIVSAIAHMIGRLVWYCFHSVFYSIFAWIKFIALLVVAGVLIYVVLKKSSR